MGSRRVFGEVRPKRFNLTWLIITKSDLEPISMIRDLNFFRPNTYAIQEKMTWLFI